MRKIKFIFFLSALICCIGCRHESDALIIDETTEEYELYDYYVDKYGNEGIVAYISKGRYILVISADETYLPWGPLNEQLYIINDSVKYPSSVYGDEQFSIAMLHIMKEKGIAKYPAMCWCYKKDSAATSPYGGSWHLPSYNEFYHIAQYSEHKKLNKALTDIGGTPLNEDNFYWTCSEDYTDYITIKGQESDYDAENRAVILTPKKTTSGVKDRWLKKNSHYVRAVKYIYYDTY